MSSVPLPLLSRAFFQSGSLQSQTAWKASRFMTAKIWARYFFPSPKHGRGCSRYFKRVEGFVLDLRARPSAGSDLLDVVAGNFQAGGEGSFVGGLPVVIDQGDRKPVDVERILAVAEWNAIDPAVMIGQGVLAGLAHDRCKFFEFNAFQVLVERLAAVWLAHKDEICTPGRHRLGQRLAEEQRVAEIDRAQSGHALSMRIKPASGPIAFAVLLLGPHPAG